MGDCALVGIACCRCDDFGSYDCNDRGILCCSNGTGGFATSLYEIEIPWVGIVSFSVAAFFHYVRTKKCLLAPDRLFDLEVAAIAASSAVATSLSSAIGTPASRSRAFDADSDKVRE